MAATASELPPVYDATEPGSREGEILEWAESALHRGRRFVEASVGYDKISKALDGIFAQERESTASYIPTPKPLSRTRANLVAKTAEDLTAQLTDTRCFWKYSTENAKYEAQSRQSNKTAKDWYTSRLIDLRLGDVIRYYTVAGTGIAHLYYSRRLGDMMLEAEDPRAVFPIDPISYHTFQDALGVIVRKARTPGWVESEYKKRVRADVGDPGVFGWISRVLAIGGAKHSGPLSRPDSQDQAIPATPTVFVNTLYLNDPRRNETKKPVYMGKWRGDPNGHPTPESQWSYVVNPGEALYPFKRLVAWGGGALLEDGPSPYWHSQFPLMKLTLNPWPKAWLGKAPLWDILSLNESLNHLLRIIDDHAAQLAQPGVVADRNVSRSELGKFNSRAPGWQIRTNFASGKGIQVVYPPGLDQSLWAHVGWILDMIQKLAGTADIAQVAKLAQIPSDDTIETLQKAMTPGVRLRSRILEGFMKELAEQYLYSIWEFDTITKRVARFGPSAVTKEDYDFDPGVGIPDDIPDGEPGDVASSVDALGRDNPRPLYQRAKAMLMSFVSNYEPASLLNSAAQQERMENLILAKMGYLSWITLMESLGKENLMPPGALVPGSEVERFALQQSLGIGMIANAQGRKATDQEPPSMGENAAGPTMQTS